MEAMNNSNRFPSSSSPFEKLPNDLVVNIISRLAQTEANRCKCVCKRWLPLISHPSFAHQFVLRNTREKPFFSLYLGRSIWSGAVDYITYDNESKTWSENSPKLSLTFLPLPSQNIEFLGSSNGLLLCSGAVYFRGPRVYYVCNPLTRQWVDLPLGPLPPSGHKYFYMGIVCTTEYCSVSTTTRFKVVRLVAPEGPHGSNWTEPSSTLSLHIFDSQTSQWSSHSKVICPHVVKLKVRDPTVVENNGILHWRGNYGLGRKVLITYDPCSDPGKCRFIDFPGDPLNETIHIFGSIYGCQGQLLFWHYRSADLQIGGIPTCSIWRLKDYESGEWCLKHSVVVDEGALGDNYLERRTGHIRQACRLPRELGIDPTDMHILFLASFNESPYIVSYDIRTRKVEVLIRCSDNFDISSIERPFMFSLPSWPTAVPKLSSCSENDGQGQS